MSQREDSSSWERLDSEFQHLLVDLKPYVQKHPVKTEQQRCALWVRKLCDPSVSASGQMGRKNRNLYTRLLLHMLRRGVLEGPFATKPEPGILKTLPTYMSIYFDEPLGRRPVQPGAADLPDWVTAELAAHEQGTLTRGLLKDAGVCSPAAEHLNTLRRRLYEERSSQPVTSSPLLRRLASSRDEPRTVDDGDITMRSETCPHHHDGDLEARLNSWNLGIENPRYLREKPIPLSPIFKSSVGGMNSTLLDEPVSLVFTQSKEVDVVRTRLLEAKHQEDKLTMQQSHDADVQNILDRKNGEMEELKAAHRAKQRDSEESVRKLEKKVQSVLRESQVIREGKEKQIGELRKMSDQSTDSLKKEWEKKAHAAVSVMEQEKFELQKKHTENIQALLEDTNLRLAKMEAEYNTHTQAADQKVRELELQVRQQAVDLEKGSALRQRLTQEKAQLEITMAGIGAELQEANRRSVSLMREHQQLGEEQEAALQKLQDKHQADMNHFQQEYALSAAKASEVIEDLERTVAHLRHQLQDLEQRRQKQLRDQETKLQKDRDQLQVTWENKVQAAHDEAEKERMLTTKKTAQLEEALREVSGQLDRARDSHRLQVQQADAALDNFKLLVESSSEKTYSQMKVQMERVEEDLLRSKSLREKQVQESTQQLEELRHRYEQQLAEQRAGQQQELSRLGTQHAAEREGLTAERQREVGSLERQARHVLQQHQTHTQEWRRRDAQTISELEKQVSAVREDLRAAQGQLAEATVLREDERQRAAQDMEASLAHLRGETERYRTDLGRSHHKEREAAQEKAKSRLKQIEKDYSQKLVKSAQLIVELQASVCDGKEEMVSVQQAQEKRLEEANARWEQERRAMVHHADHTCKALQEKVETQQRQLNSSEKKLLSKELEFQEQVTAVRQQCEVKIKGLMPAESRQQLEDTITCLKAQVNSLQNRASLLQEDLDACRNRR